MMKLGEIKSLNQVYVFKDRDLIGTLSRRENGSQFTYDKNYLEATKEKKESLRALSYRMPIGAAQEGHYFTAGENLAPFFAGLLPEGLRLQALIRTVKTSADDLFTLLIASGTDLVGDISASPTPELPKRIASEIPVLDIKKSVFWDLFDKSINLPLFSHRHLDSSIPGAHAKLSAAMISFPAKITSRKKRYILKLAPPDYPQLVENEHFFMDLARYCGLEAAKTLIVHDKDGTAGLLVERFDRIYNKKKKRFVKIHQEDACQFLNRYPQDKYRLSCREIGNAINELSTAPIIEITRFLKLKAFSYLIANGDLHAKNISLATEPETGRIIFTPAYDLLSTLPYGDSNMALQFEGRDDNLTAKDFVEFGRVFSIREEIIKKILIDLTTKITPHLDRLKEINMSEKKTVHLRKIMEKRIKDLSKI